MSELKLPAGHSPWEGPREEFLPPHSFQGLLAILGIAWLVDGITPISVSVSTYSCVSASLRPKFLLLIQATITLALGPTRIQDDLTRVPGSSGCQFD